MPRIGEEKREARRQQILDAAMRCFARNGFHRTSMEHIVRESKVSPGAIYCYFRGKHEIVAAISEQRHRLDLELVSMFASSANTLEGLQKIGRKLSKALRDPEEKVQRKVSIQFWAESLRCKKIRNILERGLRQRDGIAAALRKAQHAGQVDKKLDVDSLSRVMLALLQGLILQQAWEPELNIDAYLAASFGLLSSSLAPPR